MQTTRYGSGARAVQHCGGSGHIARAALTLVLALLSGSVLAHTRLTSSEPADGATLAAAAKVVTLEFSEAIQPRFSDFALHYLGDAQEAPPAPDNQLPRQAPVVDVPRKRVDVPLGDAPQAGWYVLDWEVLADDGHRLEGMLRFRIAR